MASSEKPEEVEMQVRLVPNPAIPYTKADVFQACRLSDAYAVNCFQFDYQTIAAWSKMEPKPADLPSAHVVTKLVMDAEGFKRLRDELNRISEITGLK
jgi:hypothetical protein